jgi:hypothetical protein
MCAPSSWRVRSPIHSMWALVSYQSPEVESIRVIASSKPSSSDSWLVKNSTCFMPGWLSGVTPMAAMKARLSLILSLSSR